MNAKLQTALADYAEEDEDEQTLGHVRELVEQKLLRDQEKAAAEKTKSADLAKQLDKVVDSKKKRAAAAGERIAKRRCATHGGSMPVLTDSGEVVEREEKDIVETKSDVVEKTPLSIVDELDPGTLPVNEAILYNLYLRRINKKLYYKFVTGAGRPGSGGLLSRGPGGEAGAGHRGCSDQSISHGSHTITIIHNDIYNNNNYYYIIYTHNIRTHLYIYTCIYI